VLGYVVGRSFARIVSDLSTASFVAVAVAGLVVTAYVVSRRHGRRPGSESTDTPAGGLSADSMETAGTPK
jgi:hypothetical protein